ncbi:hypothetical protein [Streptomyces sp.]|nr:hypothetical protein [Streptomyces sp.]
MNRSGKTNAQQVTVSQTAHSFSTAQELRRLGQGLRAFPQRP